MPRSNDEKQEFAERLKQALKRNSKKIESAADLALQFNLRHKTDSVTQQAVQKWLSGQARPTPDKIQTLAEWLEVSAQWLRFGIPEERPEAYSGQKIVKAKAAAAIQPTEDELKLLGRIRKLSEHRRYLVDEIVEQFSLEQEMWRK